jgi:hypothetical protein
MDQYRATREMPLPYQIDETTYVDDEDVSRSSWVPWQHSRSTSLQMACGDDVSSV